MNPQLMWWISRASGMVAAMLLVASLIWGVLLATRALKPVDRPAWLMEMHRWFSALACIGVVIHVVALVGDNYVYFGWREVFVPQASGWKRLPVTLGVIAMYLLILVQGTSLIMKKLPRRLWKFVHYFSYVAVWLTSVHAALAGTDVSNRLYQALALLLTITAVTFAIIRIVIGTTRAQAASRRTSGSAGETDDRQSISA
ncbi:MAG: ferric reductase-like transmembrane domain-containing protein [Actinobacteria bacterium]|nr:ferric reductase-like transmembrane domain-containing protein [Actinomycetota bacterium]